VVLKLCLFLPNYLDVLWYPGSHMVAIAKATLSGLVFDEAAVNPEAKRKPPVPRNQTV
jgi:hypothetical protein